MIEAAGQEPKGDGKRDLIIRFAGGLTISIVLLALLFSRVEFSEFERAWGKVSLWGLAGVLVVHGASLVLRVVRWRGLLQASDCGPRPSTPPSLVGHAALFGWLVNLILPARLGELGRPLMYSRGAERPFARVLGTSLVERVADLGTVALLGWSALTILPGSERLPPLVRTGVWAGTAVAALVFVAVVVVARRSGGADTATESKGLVPSLGRLREGLQSVRSPQALGRLAVESLAIWALEAFSVWLALWSFDLPLSVTLACAHVVAVTLSVSVVTLPFGLGVEQGVTVLLLEFWSRTPGPAIDDGDALALSFALSFAALAWVVPGGLWAWWKSGHYVSRTSGDPPG